MLPVLERLDVTANSVGVVAIECLLVIYCISTGNFVSCIYRCSCSFLLNCSVGLNDSDRTVSNMLHRTGDSDLLLFIVGSCACFNCHFTKITVGVHCTIIYVAG